MSGHNAMKKEKVFNFKQWLTWGLRKLSYRWPGRYKAIAAARVDRGKYQCKQCEEIVGPKQFVLDHRVPVVDPVVGFVDWNTFIERMFIEQDGYDLLCKPCHKQKTKAEGQVRTKERRKKREGKCNSGSSRTSRAGEA